MQASAKVKIEIGKSDQGVVLRQLTPGSLLAKQAGESDCDFPAIVYEALALGLAWGLARGLANITQSAGLSGWNSRVQILCR